MDNHFYSCFILHSIITRLSWVFVNNSHDLVPLETYYFVHIRIISLLFVPLHQFSIMSSIHILLCFFLNIVLTFGYSSFSIRFIKLSSPILNNVAVIGCILVYLAVMLLGFDEKTMRQDHYPLVCTVSCMSITALSNQPAYFRCCHSCNMAPICSPFNNFRKGQRGFKCYQEVIKDELLFARLCLHRWVR